MTEARILFAASNLYFVTRLLRNSFYMRRSANSSLRKLFYKYYMIKQTKWGQKCVDGMALITKTRQIVREQSIGSAKKDKSEKVI